jgi:hypothetical protein
MPVQKNLCCALIPLSPWQNLLALQNHQVFITMMVFDCELFDKILGKFCPIFLSHMPFNKSGMIALFKYLHGRKRKVQLADCLGLVLVWMQTRGLLNILQLVFGLTYSNLSVYLRFGICLIIKTYHDNPLAREALPLAEETNKFKAAFRARHPLLHDCWAIMGGLKLYLQKSGNTEILGRFFNG